MKKLIYLMAILLPFALFSQVDSTATGIDLNTEVKEVLLPSIFTILGSFGVVVTPFAGLISFVVMFIIRKIEKNADKKKVAGQIKEVLDSKETVEAKHGFLYNLVHKLEGNKKP